MEQLGELEFSSNEPAVNVYYEGGGFTPHEDNCALTVLIPLSSAADGEFAGTGFWPPTARRAKANGGSGGCGDEHSLVLKPEAGSAMLFTGDVTHAGLPVARGARAVLVQSFSRKGAARAKSDGAAGGGASLGGGQRLEEPEARTEE